MEVRDGKDLLNHSAIAGLSPTLYFLILCPVLMNEENQFQLIFLRLYLSVVKKLLMGTNILLICFLCLFYFLKNPNCAVFDEISLKISCTLYDVWFCTFLTLSQLFYTLSLCNPFRFFSFPLLFVVRCLIFQGIGLRLVDCLGWFLFFLNFHKRLRTKLQNSVTTVCWGEILGCLKHWCRMVIVFQCFCRKCRLASR